MSWLTDHMQVLGEEWCARAANSKDSAPSNTGKKIRPLREHYAKGNLDGWYWLRGLPGEQFVHPDFVDWPIQEEFRKKRARWFRMFAPAVFKDALYRVERAFVRFEQYKAVGGDGRREAPFHKPEPFTIERCGVTQAETAPNEAEAPEGVGQ